MKNRFETLDVFRGFFALIVCLYHYFPGPGFVGHTKFIRNGTYFTDFFFVLSGFVIYYNYNGLKSFLDQKKFLYKRFLRLYPLHFCMLVVFLVFEILKFFLFKFHLFENQPFGNSNIQTFFGHLFLIQAYGLPIKMPSWNGPSWSISAEFFTYVIFCLLIPFLVRLTFVRKVICFLLISVIFLSLIIIVQGQPFIKLEGFGILRCGYSFFLGCIAAVIYNKYSNEIKIDYYVLSFLELFSISISMLIITYVTASLTFLIPVTFFVTVLIFTKDGGIISKSINSPMTRRLGVLSYSIYMNNFLINSIFQILLLKVLKIKNPFVYDMMIIPYLTIIILVSNFTYNYFEVKGKKVLEGLLNAMENFICSTKSTSRVIFK